MYTRFTGTFLLTPAPAFQGVVSCTNTAAFTSILVPSCHLQNCAALQRAWKSLSSSTMYYVTLQSLDDSVAKCQTHGSVLREHKHYHDFPYFIFPSPYPLASVLANASPRNNIPTILHLLILQHVNFGNISHCSFCSYYNSKTCVLVLVSETP